MGKSINSIVADVYLLDERFKSALSEYLDAVAAKDTKNRITTDYILHIVSKDHKTGEVVGFESAVGLRGNLVSFAEHLLSEAHVATAIVKGNNDTFDFVKAIN